MPKSAMQHMFESMIGEQGVSAIENVKRILPEVPTLIENIKQEWTELRQQINDYQIQKDVDGEQREDMLEEMRQVRRLLERVATQNNIIEGKLEQMRLTVDPIATEELPPTLAHHLAQPENAETFVSKTLDFLDERESNGVNGNGNSNDRVNANG